MRKKKKRTLAQIKADAKRTGRPSIGKDARKIPVLIRVSGIEKATWTEASNAEGMSLGAWLLKPRRDEMGKGK